MVNNNYIHIDTYWQNKENETLNFILSDIVEVQGLLTILGANVEKRFVPIYIRYISVKIKLVLTFTAVPKIS